MTDNIVSATLSNNTLNIQYRNNEPFYFVQSNNQLIMQNKLPMITDLNGNILIACTELNSNGNGDFVIYRYTRDGKPDTTFGDTTAGDSKSGKKTVDLSGNSFDTISSITTDNEKNIIMVGCVYIDSNNFDGSNNLVESYVGIVKLNSTGDFYTSPDGTTTEWINGRIIGDNYIFDNKRLRIQNVSSVACDSCNNIYIGCSTLPEYDDTGLSESSSIAIISYTQYGFLNPLFGNDIATNSISTDGIANGIALLPITESNKIVNIELSKIIITTNTTQKKIFIGGTITDGSSNIITDDSSNKKIIITGTDINGDFNVINNAESTSEGYYIYRDNNYILVNMFLDDLSLENPVIIFGGTQSLTIGTIITTTFDILKFEFYNPPITTPTSIIFNSQSGLLSNFFYTNNVVGGTQYIYTGTLQQNNYIITRYDYTNTSNKSQITSIDITNSYLNSDQYYELYVYPTTTTTTTTTPIDNILFERTYFTFINNIENYVYEIRKYVQSNSQYNLDNTFAKSGILTNKLSPQINNMIDTAVDSYDNIYIAGTTFYNNNDFIINSYNQYGVNNQLNFRVDVSNNSIDKLYKIMIDSHDNLLVAGTYILNNTGYIVIICYKLYNIYIDINIDIDINSISENPSKILGAAPTKIWQQTIPIDAPSNLVNIFGLINDFIHTGNYILGYRNNYVSLNNTILVMFNSADGSIIQTYNAYSTNTNYDVDNNKIIYDNYGRLIVAGTTGQNNNKNIISQRLIIDENNKNKNNPIYSDNTYGTNSIYNHTDDFNLLKLNGTIYNVSLCTNLFNDLILGCSIQLSNSETISPIIIKYISKNNTNIYLDETFNNKNGYITFNSDSDKYYNLLNSNNSFLHSIKTNSLNDIIFGVNIQTDISNNVCVMYNSNKMGILQSSVLNTINVASFDSKPIIPSNNNCSTLQAFYINNFNDILVVSYPSTLYFNQFSSVILNKYYKSLTQYIFILKYINLDDLNAIAGFFGGGGGNASTLKFLINKILINKNRYLYDFKYISFDGGKSKILINQFPITKDNKFDYYSFISSIIQSGAGINLFDSSESESESESGDPTFLSGSDSQFFTQFFTQLISILFPPLIYNLTIDTTNINFNNIVTLYNYDTTGQLKSQSITVTNNGTSNADIASLQENVTNILKLLSKK
jgi:hypothetical protein